MIKIVKYCREGENRPFLYGSAYYDFPMRVFVCYPVPINYLVNIGRKIWYFLVFPGLPEMENKFADLLNEKFHEGYNRGKMDWFGTGYRQGREDEAKYTKMAIEMYIEENMKEYISE